MAIPFRLRLLCFCLISVIATASASELASRPPLESLAQRFERDVTVLAADDMEGRGLGTKGLDRAADWIEARLRTAGLEPAFGDSYKQPFRVKTGVAMEPGNRLNGLAKSEWTPLGFSSPGSFSGEIAFVGYGIEAPAIGFQELQGVDLKGKVALMLRYEPQERDDASPFDGRRPSRWSAVRYRVHQARERGAVAVIFVTGPLQDENQDKVPALKNDGPESPAGIPVIQVKRSVAQKWLDRAKIDLESFQKEVDRDLRPRSVGSTGVTIKGTVALQATYAEASNVVGMLRGRGPLADEIVVIGAHYDHLGYGGEHSMKPNERVVHNGADDNASGTVSVLLAAERVKALLGNTKNHRTVVFALFSAEEVGLAGSSRFVESSPFPIERIKAMINLDMVGRLRDNKLAALGAESAPEWSEAVQRLAGEVGLDVATRGDGYGPSDQTSFYARKIPVLHFFTGTHDAYHSPTDDASTLSHQGAAKVIELTARLGEELARGRLAPTYARASSAPAMEGDSRGYGAYLGTVPDYRAMEESSGGVLLSDVRPGGPADLAGIRGGDRIIEMAGTTIGNLYDMTFALQDHKPGETIDVVVRRKAEQLVIRATLGSRSSRGESQPAAAAHAPPAGGAPPVATPAPITSPPAKAPVTPPATPGAASKTPSIDPFYQERPGKSFQIKAGKPYEATVGGEKHFTNIRQLTFGGENAEAYFSPDGKQIIYQSTMKEGTCDQQFVLDLATGESRLVSGGKGRTTCGYFDFPESDRVVYASTIGASEACPPPPDRSQGYVWAIYEGYDLYEAALDGTNQRQLTKTPGYDAEATWCHRGGKLVFTSMRDGDLDLYEMNEAGDVRRLTQTEGYDGGAFFSPDCSEIVWRASRPQGAALEDYRKLLQKGLIRPTALELFIMKSDGSGTKQLTSNGAANFCPYFHPDGNRIIFSSNVGSATGREFDLWVLDKRGGEAERISFAPGFDGFPQFSPDGQWIVWASNRANPNGRETNLFVARWAD